MDAGTIVGNIVSGAVGALVVIGTQACCRKIGERKDARKIREWLQENTSDEPGKQFSKTLQIASNTNLTEERVRKACAIDTRICQSTEDPEEWSLFAREESGPLWVY